MCRTDLHVVDGELPNPDDSRSCPVTKSSAVVEAVARRRRVSRRATASAFPGSATSCGACDYCASGRENLCPNARFTGYQIDGGYAEYTVADARFCFPLPDEYDDVHAAPLLCAGLIGYRAYRMAGPGERLGIYGFGAAAHIIAQVARHQGREVYAFTTPGDDRRREFARSVGVDVGRFLERAAAVSARQRDHLRAGRRAGARGALARRRPAASWSAPAFT